MHVRDVGDVEDVSKTSKIVIIFHTHTMWWHGWKALSLSFPKLFPDWKICWILRKLWSKKRVCNILSFFWSLWSIIHIYHHLQHLQHESNYIVFDHLLRHLISSTSPTWVKTALNVAFDLLLILSHLQHLRHAVIHTVFIKLLYWDIRITLCIIIQTIRIKKYFEIMLWITWNFELKPYINLN